MVRYPFGALPELVFRSNLYPSKMRLHALAREMVGRLSGRILDIGAGEQPYKRYLGSDFEYVAMEIAGSRNGHVTGDAQHLPFADSTFDGAICTEVVEHVRDPLLAVREIGRICRPGALVYVTAPMTWPVHYEPNDYFRFTNHGLASLLEQSGFTVKETVRIGGLFTMVSGRLTDAGVTGLYRAFFPLKYVLGSGGRVSAVSALLFPVVASIDMVAALLDAVVPGTHRDCIGWAVLAEKTQEGGED